MSMVVRASPAFQTELQNRAFSGWCARRLTPDALAAAELIARVGSHDVSPAATGDPVAAAVASGHVVASRSGEKPVGAATAVEPIVACTALQKVPARSADQ